MPAGELAMWLVLGQYAPWMGSLLQHTGKPHQVEAVFSMALNLFAAMMMTSSKLRPERASHIIPTLEMSHPWAGDFRFEKRSRSGRKSATAGDRSATSMAS